MLKGLSTISLPTEAIKITSADGELLELTTCVLLFKVRVIENEEQNGYVGRDVEPKTENYLFESQLELYDSNGDGLIKNGEKQIQFYSKSNVKEMSLSKQAMWKLKHFVKKSLSLSMIGNGEINSSFMKPAQLRFDLRWSRELRFHDENKENGSFTNGGIASKRRVFTRSRSTGSIVIRRSFATAKSNETIQCLVYQFIHKNYRQKTEIWGCFKCPWCTLKTTILYNLLKHLTLCHDRFKFKYVPGANEIRIDVFVNKHNDNDRIDPFSRMATKFQGREPHKREAMSTVLIYKPERNRPKLAEFQLFDNNGMKRIFHHSFSGLPVKPTEIDVNSEDEFDPIWLRQNTVRMIDEFVDVNNGEKEMIKLWNLHVLKHAIIADIQIPKAIVSFIDEHGEYILANNLHHNCIVHFTNLFDYGLISDADMYEATHKLHVILLGNQLLRDSLVQRHDEQLKYTLSKIIKVNKCPSGNSKSTSTKQKRPSNHVISTIKKRLRSHSRSGSHPRNKIKRTDALRNSKKLPTMNAMHQAARKSAKITN